VSFIVFAQVLAIASEVRALKSLVEALEPVLVDLSPWHFLCAALGFVFTGHFQLLELVDNIRMSLAGLESFEVAARTGKDVLLFPFIHA